MRRAVLSSRVDYGLHDRQVAYATRYTKGFSRFVTSSFPSIATGRSDPVPGWDLHPLWSSAFARRTITSGLAVIRDSLTFVSSSHLSHHSFMTSVTECHLGSKRYWDGYRGRAKCLPGDSVDQNHRRLFSCTKHVHDKLLTVRRNHGEITVELLLAMTSLRPLPSRFTLKITAFFSWRDEKAIFRPSGNQFGSGSSDSNSAT